MTKSNPDDTSTSQQAQAMVLRLFHVQAKKGHAAELVRKFATTSASVVQHEPGNKGYFFGQGISTNEDTALFASLWTDLDALKQRFGENWQHPFLPEGYEDLIQDCSIEHIEISPGSLNLKPDK